MISDYYPSISQAGQWSVNKTRMEQYSKLTTKSLISRKVCHIFWSIKCTCIDFLNDENFKLRSLRITLGRLFQKTRCHQARVVAARKNFGGFNIIRHWISKSLTWGLNLRNYPINMLTHWVTRPHLVEIITLTWDVNSFRMIDLWNSGNCFSAWSRAIRSCRWRRKNVRRFPLDRTATFITASSFNTTMKVAPLHRGQPGNRRNGLGSASKRVVARSVFIP